MIRALGYLWALPQTILFYIVLRLLSMTGAARPLFWYSYYGGFWWWRADGWLLSWYLRSRWTGMTIGWIVLTGEEPASYTMLRHEARHVHQNLIFGPFFLPFYFLGYFVGILSGHWYEENPFEVDARENS